MKNEEVNFRVDYYMDLPIESDEPGVFAQAQIVTCHVIIAAINWQDAQRKFYNACGVADMRVSGAKFTDTTQEKDCNASGDVVL